MIRIGRNSIVALVVVWVASMFVAFQVGEGQRAAHSEPWEDLNPEQTRGLSSGGIEIADYFNETRRRGAQSRFLVFAQTLGGDELSRILPEITDKMSLDQVQSTLRRLFEEVEPGPSRRTARFELIRRWAQLEPEAALGHVGDLDDPKMRHDLRLKGLEGWASIDPAAALEFARDSESELIALSKEAVWTGFAATRDLDLAFAFVETLAEKGEGAGADKAWTVSKAVEALFHNDDLAVIRWVEKLEPGALREQAVSGLIEQWTLHDPEAAREWSIRD